MTTFLSKINVIKNFQTSINIAYDLNNDEKIKNFILTSSFLEIIEDFILSVKSVASRRSRLLIGSYGRGKSHLILVLLSMLYRKEEKLFTNLLNKIRKMDEKKIENISQYLESSNKLLPIVIRGSSSNLSQSFLSALEYTLNDWNLMELMPETSFQAVLNTINNWQNNYRETYEQLITAIDEPIEQFLDKIQEYNFSAYEKFENIYPKLTAGSLFNPLLGFDIVELYEKVAKNVLKVGYNGIFVVYDEFSKYLESSIATASVSDIKLLQDFAEKCDRSGSLQMHLLLIAHKDIANYIDDKLKKEKVDGWRGVSGRFKHIYIADEFTQTYELIAATIKADIKWFETVFYKKHKDLFNDLVEYYAKTSLFDTSMQIEVKQVVKSCFPLHPVTAFILPRLSEKVAQNERTLFTFLAGNEKYTLYDFLSHTDEDFILVTPDYLYDYFQDLFKQEPYASESYQIYKLTTKILKSLPESSLFAKIVKTIALIYVIEQFDVLPPTIETIIGIFKYSYTHLKEITDAIEALIKESHLIYLKRSNSYLKLKESSGVNISDEILKYVETTKLTLTVEAILNNINNESYLYPTRYNIENEVIRYFKFSFIDSKSFDEIDWENNRFDYDGDGIVFAILPSSDTSICKIISKIEKLKKGCERFVFVLPKKHMNIDDIIYEYDAVLNLRELSLEDELLTDEYDMYFLDLQEVLAKYINSFLIPELQKSNYFYKGKIQFLSRRTHLTSLLSDICEELYFKYPIINNEFINKNTITTVALNSRNKIVGSLLMNKLLPNLGFTGYGQEVSIMRGVLVNTNILENFDNENIAINLAPTDPNMSFVLDTILKFFVVEAKNSFMSLGLLYKYLINPKYAIGLKREVIPIFIAVILHSLQNKLTIVCKRKEVKITVATLNDINRNPNDYFIQYTGWDETKEVYSKALISLFEFENKVSVIDDYATLVNSMVDWYMNLSKYAKELKTFYKENNNVLKKQEISIPLKKFLNALKSETNNPYQFLFDKLPSIFNKKYSQTELIDEIASAKTVYDTALLNLKKYIIYTLKELFESVSQQTSLASTLRDWTEKLSVETKNHLFDNNQNQILILLEQVGNNELNFVEDLGRLVVGLRLTDWNEESLQIFISEMEKFKDDVESFDKNAAEKNIKMTNSYKIIFYNSKGNELVRTFDKVDYDGHAKLLHNEITTALEETGRALTADVKRQVLIEFLERFC